VVSLDYSCLRKKLVSDKLNGHEIRLTALFIDSKANARAQECMGSIYAEMSCRYIGTGAHSWPLSPLNRRGLREREYKRGGLYVPYTKQRRFFTRYKSETK
jgi:hypothetical protein